MFSNLSLSKKILLIELFLDFLLSDSIGFTSSSKDSLTSSLDFNSSSLESISSLSRLISSLGSEAFNSSSLELILSLSLFLALTFTSSAFSSGFESILSFLRSNSSSFSIFLLNLISFIFSVFLPAFFFLDLKIELIPKPFDKDFLDLFLSLISLVSSFIDS